MARPDRARAGGSKRPRDGHPRVHRSDRRHRVCAVIHRNRMLRSRWLATSCIARVHRASAMDDALLFVVMLGDSSTTHGRFLYHHPSRTRVDLSIRRLAELDSTTSWLRSIRKNPCTLVIKILKARRKPSGSDPQPILSESPPTS